MKCPGRFLFLLILLFLAACQQAQSPGPTQLPATITAEISEVEPAGTPTLQPPTISPTPTEIPPPSETPPPASETPAPEPTATPTPAGPWTQLSGMRKSRSEMPAAILNGLIYVPGGFANGNPIYENTDTLEAYDPATDTWATLAPMPEPRNHLMAATYGDYLYVFGGAGGPDTANLSNTWRYDPAADNWTTLADMPEERVAGAAVALGEYIYIVGGQGETNALLRYEPGTDSWTTLAPLREPREHNAAVVLDGVIYALGGRWTGTTTGVERYDPATDTWSVAPPLRQKRAGFGAAVLDGKIYVAGGEVIDGAPIGLDTMEVFDPAGGRWQLLDLTLPGPLHGVPLAALDGRLYVIGGSGVAGVISNRGDLFVTTPANFVE